MPTRKIRDIDRKYFNTCRHPEHNPPSLMVFQPGEYEHECPGCGHITRFTVFPTHWLGGRPSVVVEPLGRDNHVFYVHVPGMSPHDVDQYIDKVRKTISEAKTRNEDLFIPMR